MRDNRVTVIFHQKRVEMGYKLIMDVIVREEGKDYYIKGNNLKEIDALPSRDDQCSLVIPTRFISEFKEALIRACNDAGFKDKVVSPRTSSAKQGCARPRGRTPKYRGHALSVDGP